MTGIETRLKRLTSVLGRETPDVGSAVYRCGYFHVLHEKIGNIQLVFAAFE